MQASSSPIDLIRPTRHNRDQTHNSQSHSRRRVVPQLSKRWARWRKAEKKTHKQQQQQPSQQTTTQHLGRPPSEINSQAKSSSREELAGLCKINGDLRVLRRWRKREEEEEEEDRLGARSEETVQRSKMYVIFFFFFFLFFNISLPSFQVNVIRARTQRFNIIFRSRSQTHGISHPRQFTIYYINWNFRWNWASVTHLFFNWTQRVVQSGKIKK